MAPDQALLSLVRSGIGHGECQLPPDVDWPEVYARAKHHGVTAIAMDGLLASGAVVPRDLMRLWMADTVKMEAAYAKGVKVISDLAAEYQQAGIPLMILKGYGLSLNYPVPNHRPTGDIDTWNFGKQKDADKFLAERDGTDIDNGVHHHTVFYYERMMVENHYDFLNVYSHRSNARMEKELKAMVASPGQCVPSGQISNVFFPPTAFNSLYLLRHTAAHFAAEKVNLRQILDWGTFVGAHQKEIDWDSLCASSQKYNMDRFLSCICQICVDELGFDSGLFPAESADPVLKQRVLDDILDTRSSLPEPGIRHIGQRLRRWSDNSWKHKIVYNESRLETFWAQTVAHLMKPASFRH